ncbi:MAG: HDIG domain-containing protein [Actinomycetota bacterium]|nr:HDIG domain-containing protein [Actinomycetota bacterium]
MTANIGAKKIKELRRIIDWRGTTLRRSILVLFIFSVTLAVLTIDFLPDRLTGIKIGKPSPKTVKASRNVEFTDFEKTNALRREAASHVQKVYTRDWVVEARVTDSIHKFFGLVRQVRANQALTPEAKLDLLIKQADPSFNKSVLGIMLIIPDNDLNAVESKVVSQIDQLYRDQITPENIDKKKNEFREAINSLTDNENEKSIITEVGTVFLKPNYFYDERSTERLRAEAAAGVAPIVVSKQKGEIVIREGEIVTSTQIKILKELGLMQRGVDITRLAGLALFALITFFAFSLYLYNYQRKIYDSDRLISVLAIIFITTVLVAKFVGPFYSFYLIPVGAAAMLTVLLFNVELAVLMVLVISLFSGLIAGQNYQYVLYGLLTGIFAIHAIYHIRHRTDLVLAGTWVTLATAILALLTTLLSSPDWFEILRNLGWGLLGGISTAVLTAGALPFLEKLSGITTDIKLVELSYANQPLLRELMMKAPGTYNHSVMAGNLAESAAEAIGANPLLARVGAYYHDIGKVKRPLFFVENQIGGENPHDHTNPNLSCLIITSHVKEGVELAKKHRLPKEIVNIINEHHGTSIVAYFYHKAKENIVKEVVSEEDFRYSGQRPRTKEAALVMLADSVEAAARTITKPSPSRIEQLIRRIVQNKLDDGQLSESNLTLNDIETIIKSFSQVLSSLYHTRIEYPASATSQARSLATHGNLNK